MIVCEHFLLQLRWLDCRKSYSPIVKLPGGDEQHCKYAVSEENQYASFLVLRGLISKIHARTPETFQYVIFGVFYGYQILHSINVLEA